MFTFLIVLTEHMAANIRAEFKRLQRRKQLQFSSNVDNSDGSSSGGEQTDSPRSEKPLFTFKQVCYCNCNILYE